MGKFVIAGLDPSLSNFGMVKGALDLHSGTLSDMIIALSESPPIKAKKAIRQNTLDLQRARLHYKAMTVFLSNVNMVCIEIPVGSQSARSMASYGICVGILSSIGKPIIQVTPAEVKIAATNSKTASKELMIDWATNKYPDLPWLTNTRKGVKTYANKNEHIADALAAIYAGVRTDEFEQARSLLITN